MKLLLSPLAADDLHSIHSYISEEIDNPSAAGRLIKDIVKAYKQLKDTPGKRIRFRRCKVPRL